MTKRTFWLLAGFGLGVTATARVRRHLDERTAARAAVHLAGERLRRVLGDAVNEGREEMRRREVMLRSVLAAPGRPEPGR